MAPAVCGKMKNATERAAGFAASSVIAVGDLPAEIRRPTHCGLPRSPPGLEDELPLAEATEVFLRAKVRRTLEIARRRLQDSWAYRNRICHV